MSADIDEFATELRLVLGQLLRRLRAERPRNELSWSMESVLALLDRTGPRTITGLARADAVRSQSMSNTVSVLESRGLVTRRPSDTDGRQSVIVLTDAGETALAELRAAKQHWLSHTIGERLTPEEQRRLAETIPLLRRLAEPDDPADRPAKTDEGTHP